MQDERPIGPVVEGWNVPPAPDGAVLQGRYAYLEPLSADAHAALLYDAFDGQDWIWDYMPVGPFTSSAQFYRWMSEATAKDDIHFYAIRDLETGEWGGFGSYLRVKPAAGSIEVGFIAMAVLAAHPRRDGSDVFDDAMGV